MKKQLTDRASIPALLQDMSLDEKLTLLTGRTPFLAGGCPDRGIPNPLFLDGGTGFNTMQMEIEASYRVMEEQNGAVDAESLTSPLAALTLAMAPGTQEAAGEQTDDQKKRAARIAEILDETRPTDRRLGCYPPGMFFGATMNPDVIYRCGEALGREASACHVDVLLGTPNVNLHRDPRCGRLFEGYSEDPCVVKTLAPSFVRGVQETGVVANVKHFAANNQETERMGVNEFVGERALRELYLPGFKACVDAGCKTLMSSYNQINNFPSSQNPWLLRKVLRDEWGFKGFVMSDWGGVYDRVAAQKAGNDVCMPGPRSIAALKAAVASGELTMEQIDEACTNYLNILLEMPIMKGRKYTKIDCDYSLAAAYDAAKEGITLLKNNGVLPLSKSASVAFYGARSKKFCESGAGSAEVATELSTNMYDSTCKLIGSERVSFEEITAATDYVVVTIGANGQEGADRPDMEMEPADRPVLERAIAEAKAAQKPVILVLNIAAPIDIAQYVDQVAAILCVYLPGMCGGQAAADILFGDVNPSGKLPLSFPKHYCDTPTYLNFPGEGSAVTYGEGIYVGYRYYDKKNIAPLYPFGFGLSYTTFALSDLSVPSCARLEDGNTLPISVNIRNTGRMAGSEVVQIYVSDVQSTLDKPVKELKALKKVYLQPGEQKTVCFELTKQDLANYDVKQQSWTTEPGEYQILVGTSSRDIALSASVEVKCVNPYGLTPFTPIASIVADQTAVAILKKHIPGCNPVADASFMIVFQPQVPFCDAWQLTFATKLSGSEAEKKAVYDAICADFETANRAVD